MSAYAQTKDLTTLKREYGEYLFSRDEQNNYVCFFAGCGQKLKANFQRHVSRHQDDEDEPDKRLMASLKARHEARMEEWTAVATKECVYEDHERLWPGVPRVQPEESFYSNSTKCKKCYIYLQSTRIRRARLGLAPLEPAGNRSSSRLSRRPVTPVTRRPVKRVRETAVPPHAHLLAPGGDPLHRAAAVGALWAQAIVAEVSTFICLLFNLDIESCISHSSFAGTGDGRRAGG